MLTMLRKLLFLKIYFIKMQEYFQQSLQGNIYCIYKFVSFFQNPSVVCYNKIVWSVL